MYVEADGAKSNNKASMAVLASKGAAGAATANEAVNSRRALARGIRMRCFANQHSASRENANSASTAPLTPFCKVANERQRTRSK